MGFRDFFTRMMPNGPKMLATIVGFFPGASSELGRKVTHENALTVTAVWRSIQILSDAIVGLPVSVTNEANEKQIDHAASMLLQNGREANEFMSSADVKGALVANCALWGNAYAYIDRDPSSYKPVGLYPLSSSHVTPRRVNGVLTYVALVNGQTFNLNPDQVFHFKGPLTLDGITALSPIEYGRNTVGLSMALESFASKFFSQGGNLGGIIETPPMKKPERDSFLENWRATYTGENSAFKIAALTGGFKFHPTSADPQASQSTESREHQVLEVARIWGIPPHMLFQMIKASYASIEMQNIEFYQGTIAPYVVRFEAEITRKLFAENEKGRLKVCLNMDAKLRGTTADRYKAYAVGWGRWLTTNEIREKENMPKHDKGDVLLEPMNMRPAGSDSTGGGNATTGGDGSGDASNDAGDDKTDQNKGD